ncbi:MAG TPA: patatin-like phospholipase family protein [Thermoanaerobaculia bacterium]|nr:patatin-like phospholipase family protein [Thermoanaerobaculia bacterium]
MSESQPSAVREARRLQIEADEKRAAEVLSSSGKLDAADMLKLAKQLAAYKRFGLARRILKRVRLTLNRTDCPDDFLEIYQKSSLCTYKDPDLPLEWRLDRALEILGQVENLANTESQETLGLAGAIYKRKWELDFLRQNLERAHFYYLRGYALGVREEHLEAGARGQAALMAARADVIRYLSENPECKLWADEDRGYCGINAAFVLDLLANEEDGEARRAGLASHAADGRRNAAKLIREEIIRSVPPLLEKKENEWLAKEWWFYATLAEAYFGLGRYEDALEWLVKRPANAADTGLDVPEWEYESTARQLTQLARLHCDPAITEEQFESTEAGKALAVFLGHDSKALRSTFRGKFGLGLSGGGFRASLFHIGVLARLAELDVLRHVEVLSCVSGGSIIGAHYYLELRKLLETRSDDDITREDYIEIVDRVQRDFLAGVQRNIRTRVLAEWTTNLKMIFSSGYTRTLRVGELYERELFSKVKDGEEGKERLLNELFIRPKLPDGSRQTDFNPRNHNWRRKNKAPILVLNATCLNTGHSWQFTASFMGEPPSPINRDIDCNYRLRRMYYQDAPEKYRKFRLGHAVAASACVPGLFEPLILDGLYPDDGGQLKDEHLISVRLVDGGVCDNQGVGSLLEQECTVMLVSDASGQMDAVNVPGGGPIGTLLRTSSVSQSRVREAQYTDVAGRRRSALLRGLMFIHLRQDLAGRNIAWKDCPSSLKESDFESQLGGPGDATSFNVSTEVQRKLSAIRTDLDSFSEAEAYALMTSAYRMTAQQFDGKKCVEGFPSPETTKAWRFLEIENAMKPDSVVPGNERRKHLERLLDVGSGLAFKIWNLSTPLIVLKWLLAAAVVVGIVALFYGLRESSIVPSSLTYKKVGVLILTAIAFAAIAMIVKSAFGKKSGKKIMQAIRWRDTLKNIAIGFVMSTIGFLLARLHLHVFDRLFLRYGRLDKFPG